MPAADSIETTLTIRPFRDADEPQVTVLWERCFPDNPPRNAPARMIAGKRRVQPELFLVGLVDDNVVATAMGGYDGHRGWVYAVATDPGFRRLGYGRALMRAVEQALAQLGCPKLNLQVRTTNSSVVAFYRSLGYVVEERISMGKELPLAAGHPHA
jgi:ribosomal protein S18 acetylase RimI-like enzyme